MMMASIRTASGYGNKTEMNARRLVISNLKRVAVYRHPSGGQDGPTVVVTL